MLLVLRQSRQSSVLRKAVIRVLFRQRAEQPLSRLHRLEQCLNCRALVQEWLVMDDKRLHSFQAALLALHRRIAAVEILRCQFEDFSNPMTVDVLEREHQPVEFRVLAGDLKNGQDFSFFEGNHRVPPFFKYSSMSRRSSWLTFVSSVFNRSLRRTIWSRPSVTLTLIFSLMCPPDLYTYYILFMCIQSTK